MKTSELIVELGVEEIPAWMLEDAARQFAQVLQRDLGAQRLASETDTVWFTPRRIVVGLTDIPDRQEDLFETVTGPPKNAAYGPDGEPTKAALGFAQRSGISLEQIRIIQTSKGEYLSAVKKIRGERTLMILQRLIPEAISKIQFPKTMHWTADKFRFVRPLRWILALYGGKVVRFRLADVTSSDCTSGHRFLGKARIKISSLSMLQEVLRENGVLVDPRERACKIQEALSREAEGAGGLLLPDPDLLKTVVNLNEHPSVILGSFESPYLSLPKEILVSVMREHQKYFSVLGRDGEVLPVFLAVINLPSDGAEKIRAGHERVLRARLADASFFWETDRKTRLCSREELLKHVLFQEKMGSYYDKTQRIVALMPRLSEMVHRPDLLPDLESAAHMCKCDLVTEMVKEFTDLQGIVGGLYSRAEGYPEAVWRAIYEHYMPKSTGSASPSTIAGALIALADRLDTVGGCFSAGLIPSGSKDPFGVRRQGNGILKILLDHGMRADLGKLIQWGLEAYGFATPGTAVELKKFFEGRLRFMLEEMGCDYDCVNAALAAGFDDPLDAVERVRALQAMRGEADFLSVASNFKRIVNILNQADAVSGEPDTALMADNAEGILWDSYLAVLPEVEAARASHDYESALRSLASLRRAVDAFFDTVLVMTDDLDLRKNRLKLLGQLGGLFRSVADISQIVIDQAPP